MPAPKRPKLAHPLPCRAKRIAAGVSLEAIAKRLRVSTAYLARCERHGFTWVLRDRAVRMRAYPNCGRMDFLPQKQPTLPAPTGGPSPVR